MDRKFSQLPEVTAEDISGDDMVVLLTANGNNAIAKVATLAQGLSDNEVTAESLGLGNVDNTADINKPVSQAQQNALDLKADKTELEGYATSGQVDSVLTQVNLAIGGKASQEELNAGLSAVNERIDNLTPGNGGDGVSQEDVDASIATAIAPLATTEALNTAVGNLNERIDNLGEGGNGGVTMGQVDQAISTAVAPLATTEAMTQALAGKADAQVVTDLANATETAITGINERIDGLPTDTGVTEAQMTQAISDATSQLATAQALASGLAEKVDNSDLASLATKEELTTAVDTINQRIDGLPAGGGDGVSQAQVDQSIATAIAPLATTDALTQGLSGKADASALADLVTASALNDALADKAGTGELNSLAQVVEGKADVSALQGLATTESVTEALAGKANVGDLEGLATSESVAQAVSGLATETYVNEAIAAIPPAQGGVSQEDVDSSIATAIAPLASTQALTDGLASKLDASAAEGFASTQALTDGLAGKVDNAALGEYATIEALGAGLQTKADASALAGLASSASVDALAETVALKADASALTGLASETFVNSAVDTAVNNLVGGAPGTLDTLKEISDALAADANFSATITQQLAGKANTEDLAPLATTEATNAAIAAAVAGMIHLSGAAPAQGNGIAFIDGEWVPSDSKTGKLVWVDVQNPAVFRNGTYDFPFATIQDAIDSVAGSPIGTVIQVLNGTYAGFTINGLTNLHIQGFATPDSPQTVVVGKVTLTGASCTRIKMKDFQIKSAAVGELALEFNGTQGRHYFDNVTIEYTSGGTVDQPLVEFNGAFTNWVDTYNCAWNGQVHFAHTYAASAAFYMRGANGSLTHLIQDTAITIALTNSVQMGYVKHIGGILRVHGSLGWTGKNGVAIDSSAAVGQGELRLAYSDFSKTSGAGFMAINKTGDCAYRLSYVNLDPATSLPGEFVNAPAAQLTVADVLAKTRPEITATVNSFGEGDAVLDVNVVTTNGYYMGAVQLHLNYKKVSDADWTSIAAQSFTDGQLAYSFVASAIDDDTDYEFYAFVTDGNAPNLDIATEVGTFNHPAG